VLSATYETSGRGVSTVSSGVGRGGKPDAGGVSYGSYQLTSQSRRRNAAGRFEIVRDGGSVAKFLTKDGARWAPAFKGLRPGSRQFDAVWQTIARREPDELHAAEHAFVKRENYDRAVRAIRSATGVNPDMMHPVIRDVLWSAAVQHGPGSSRSGAAMLFSTRCDGPTQSCRGTQILIPERSFASFIGGGPYTGLATAPATKKNFNWH
jgi:hypothetical protein